MKLQKKSQPRNWFGEEGTSRGYEWHQIDPKWLGRSLMLFQDQFGIIHNIQISPIPQTNFLIGTLFAVSYCKLALVACILSVMQH